MTFKIFKNYTQKIIFPSNSCPGDDLLVKNIRIYPDAITVAINPREETFLDNNTVHATPFTISVDRKY